MKVSEIMTSDVACCSADATIQEAARMMHECDCGEIPVVDANGKPVGVVTDRDIACRAVASGKDAKTPVREVMSEPVITVHPDDSLEECCTLMESRQVRRVPVVDDDGCCCGIVSQADIALHAPGNETAELVRDISAPVSGASTR